MTGILNILAGALGVAKDTYFNLVSLLLPGNGTNGAQNNTFLDSSTNNFTITRNGNTTQGTFSPFSQTGWGNYFSGGANYLTAPNNTALDLSTGDFTVECWFYPTSFSSTSALVYRYNGNYATGNDFQYAITVNTSGSVIVRPYQGTTDFTLNAGTAVLNTWNHIALVRTGNTFWGFVNGNRSASSQTISGALNNSTWATTIGAALSGSLGNTYATGYISNVRITKGGALYTTATYTVPTAPLTTTVSAGTVSLLTCQSNRFLDNSSNAFTITVNGSPTVVAFSPFAPTAAPTAAYTTAAVGGSGYFDGTGDYLTVPYSTALQLTGDFTIEVWVNLVSKITNFPCIVNNYNVYGTNGGFAIFANHNSGTANKYNVALNGSFPVINSTDSITYNAWQHIALVRSGSGSNNITLYVNGVANGTTTSTVTITGTSNNWWIGASGDDLANSYINGYISNFRVLKGTALYTGNFTPPTAPLTAITNTQLLLNFTNAGITDATAKNDLETVGNAQISTSVSKFGGGSIAFDGNGDGLYRPNTDLFNFGTGNFTIEFWLYYSSKTGYQTIASLGYSPGASTGWLIQTGNGDGKVIFYVQTSGTVIASDTGSTVNTGQWYHIAIVRNSGTTTIYRDGTSVGSGSDSTNYSTTGVFYIGGGTSTGFNGGYFNGYIDDFRITKGVARYTGSTYTVPTAPFPVQ